MPRFAPVRTVRRATAAAAAGLVLIAAPAHAEEGPVGGPRMAEAGLVLDLPLGVPTPPELKVACYVLANLNTGAVLAAKCPHTTGLPASTLKTLTALAITTRLPPTTVVEATSEDAAIEGSKVGLDPGLSYTVDELLAGLMLSSGNDAANALARANGGMAATTTAMNEVAATLGARDTKAVNDSGLDAPGQVTSAYDMALFGRAAIANPQVAGYTAMKTRSFPGKRIRGQAGGRSTFEITNHNKLLFNYVGALGVKTGYTVAAKHTLIAAVRRADQAYVLSFLGGAAQDWKMTASVFDWAFAHGSQANPVGRLVDPSAALPLAATSPSATQAPASAAQPAAESGGVGVLGIVGTGLGALAAAVVGLRARGVVAGPATG